MNKYQRHDFILIAVLLAILAIWNMQAFWIAILVSAVFALLCIVGNIVKGLPALFDL